MSLVVAASPARPVLRTLPDRRIGDDVVRACHAAYALAAAASFSVTVPAMARGGRRRAGIARHVAQYLVVTELNISARQLAQAIGRSPWAVSKSLRRIEDLRDDAEIDRAIEAARRIIETCAGVRR